MTHAKKLKEYRDMLQSHIREAERERKRALKKGDTAMENMWFGSKDGLEDALRMSSILE